VKTKILLLISVLLLSGCATTKTVQPLPPVQENVNAMKSSYRKTVEVLLISCLEKETGTYVIQGDHRKANQRLTPVTEQISIVETTNTGERFEMFGCYGKPGDKFRISY
jgi:uncharacterized lipoprotein YajG